VVRKTEKKLDAEAEGKRRTEEIRADKKFMEGVYRSLEDVQKGVQGTRLKDIKRKYKRA
jgi:hypothetical protein